MMTRRAMLGAAAGWWALGRAVRASEPPRDAKITRAVGFDLPSRRSKVAGKNARLDVHGDRTNDRMLRLFTNVGVEGLGNCRADEAQVAKLIGADPFALFRADRPEMTGPLGVGTMPLWDLLGKLSNKPAYAVMGRGPTGPVPVYDGSIYFADLLPQHADRWADQFRTEIDMGLEIGHKAFKVKVGRGSRWMPRAEGDRRDVEVVRLIREHAGKDVQIGVDANNGYDLEGAKRFLDQVGDCDLMFVEELFPEVVAECLALKEHIKAKGWKTLLADGETQGELDVFKPFVAAGAIDVYQADMNRFGFEGMLTESAMVGTTGTIAPHNWGSLIGYYMQLHVGRAIPNFYKAEHDPLSTPVLRADGYARKDGSATLPDSPGFGLAIDEAEFERGATIRFELR